MGRNIAEMYEYPQDIEWAWVTGDSGATHPKEGASHLAWGEVYILQSRPITTLFPLPEGLPLEPLKAMIGFHVVQGILEPMTPLGRQSMEHILTGGALAFGADYTYDNQTAFYTAAERIWINVTGIIRHPLGLKAYPRAIKSIDPAVGQIFEHLMGDPRLAPVTRLPKPRTIFNLLKFIIPFWGRIIKYWRHPHQGAGDFFALMEEEMAKIKAVSQRGHGLWDRFRTHLELWQDSRFLFPRTVVPRGVSAVVAGMVPFFGILQPFSAQTGHPQRYLEIARGLPNNVTTEMDLILWETAQTIRDNDDAYQAFTNTSARQLAEEYLSKELPPAAQKAVEKFMSRYGMRGLGEIDLGRPRWREEPLHIMQTIKSYLSITDPEQAPDVVFARGAEAARKAGEELINDVRQLRWGWFKSRLVRMAIGRYRALAGLREAPKFFAIRVMGVIRQGFLESGRALDEAGLLENPDDLFFLYAPELEEAAEKETITPTMRESIQERRETRAREMKRVQLPRVLLSDGRVFFEGLQTGDGETDSIVGDPVSPGVVEGKVRVVLNPHETQLLPGEILVCPGTDPAWTPLFLAAGGLVMEVGGMMTHGSVVAREYGIPAVVGVHEATTRLETGQRVRVDGSTGRVLILDGGG
ncbi:MAG: Prodigiosin synthesizing transferase PigC [Chloroflexi bacterium]|nr:Prodigiosin synthesizing transferase PigC [Chloroflexota bacterium]